MDNPILGLLKLIDYGASGIGSVAGPMLAPWRARREARATLIDAEAETDSLKILAQGRATALQIISNAQAEARSTLADQNSTIDGEINIQEAISQRIVYQEEKRQSNILF
jgi:ribonuclease HII